MILSMPVDVIGIAEKRDMMLGLNNSMALSAERLHLFLGEMNDEQAQ